MSQSPLRRTSFECANLIYGVKSARWLGIGNALSAALHSAWLSDGSALFAARGQGRRRTPRQIICWKGGGVTAWERPASTRTNAMFGLSSGVQISLERNGTRWIRQLARDLTSHVCSLTRAKTSRLSFSLLRSWTLVAVLVLPQLSCHIGGEGGSSGTATELLHPRSSGLAEKAQRVTYEFCFDVNFG